MNPYQRILFEFVRQNQRGSLLFSSKATRPLQFSAGRKLNKMFISSSENIDHDLKTSKSGVDIDETLGTIVQLADVVLTHNRNNDSKFYYRMWVVQNTAQRNPHLSSIRHYSTFCLWIFFSRREKDYVWTYGLGEKSHEYVIYGCVIAFLADIENQILPLPLHTQIIVRNLDIQQIADAAARATLEPIYNFDS